MKFSLKSSVCLNGYRSGELSGLRSNPELVYETPLLLINTKGGSVPHLVKDVYHESFSKNSLLCIPAQHFADQLDVLQLFKKGVTNFASLPTHPVCTTLQDSLQETPSGYNEASSVSFWGPAGRIKLSPKGYIDIITAMLPDWYEALSDSDTNLESSKKRVEKSIKNSTKFVQECIKLHKSSEDLNGVGILGPLLGGMNPLDRRKWSEIIVKEQVDGYSLCGFHSNGVSAQSFEPQFIRKCVQASLECVPSEKIRQIQGCFSIASVLELIQCGVDVFDSSPACLASESGLAHCFPNILEEIERAKEENMCDGLLSSSNSSSSTQSATALSEEQKGEDNLNKKLKSNSNTESEFRRTATNASDSDDNKNCDKAYLIDSNVIDLRNSRYKVSLDPILKYCGCYTCKNFTRGYIHHLLSVREMLSFVLLMIHNLHHWEVFFQTIRESIKTEKFDNLKTFFNPTTNIDEEFVES